MVSGKPSVMAALLVASLAALTLASETRHYASNTGVLGGVGGLHGTGALGGVGHVLNAGLGHDLAAGLGLGHSLDSGLGVGPAAPSAFGSGLGHVAAGYGPSGKCKKWCKAPTGKYECCDDLKPGQCPPVRPTCPSVRSVLPPTPCTNDAYCLGTDKCCYDACLEYRTCKPILSYY